MNEVVNKFLLPGDKFMPEIHSNQPEFTYSACGPFTKNNERIEKFIQIQKQIQMIFKGMILIKFVFNMIWLMINIRIYLKDYNQMRF